nr:zinc finger, CCHC-type [Tanacetum cinerariifolium]
MVATMKHMGLSFSKLEKFKRVDFRRWQKKMHFMLSSMCVVYVRTTPLLEDGGENPTVKQVRRRAKWDNDNYVCRGLILNDFEYTLKHLKEEFTLIELGSRLRIEESLRVQESDKPNGNNVAGPSVVNMVKHNNSSRYNDNKGKHKHHDTRANTNKKPKVTCWKCGKPRHLKRIAKLNDDITWWVDSGVTCWFKTSESLNNRSILHMGNELTALVHRHGCVDLRLNIVSDNIGSAFMSTSKLNDSILWHARLGHVHFKRMQDMSKDGLIPAFDMDTKKCKTCMLTKTTKKLFQNVKRKTKVLELIHSDLCDLHATLSLKNKKYFVTFIDDASRFCYVYLLHTKDEALDKFKVFKAEVELQQKSLIKRFKTNRGVVRLPDPKLKTLGERGIECILVGYAEHSKAFRFYVIEPNDSVAINSIIESRDSIFDEHRLLIAMASIHNLIIHQMNVKTAFLNEELEEKVYMNQSLGFIMPGNENKAPKQWHQKFDEVVLSNGYLLNQADKCVYVKFYASGKGVIICLYVDDMLIFGTHQVQVDLTKEFLSSRFSLKGIGEADVILVSTPLDTYEKLVPNNGPTVSQLEYSRVIGCLMYVMTCTRPDIAFVVGKLSSCDSAATLAKAYSQMYNGKSRHLGVRHSMIPELITNGVVSIEFMRSQQNLADHLTKGLSRDLVIKSAKGMGLKSN